MNIQSIKAVSTTPPLDIKAALASPEVRAVSRILAKAGVQAPTTSRIAHSHLESCMCSAGVSPEERMRCKIALDRAHLIDWSC
jgi:hypothetical protein